MPTRLFEETQLGIIRRAQRNHPATWETLGSLIDDVGPLGDPNAVGIFGCVDVDIAPCLDDRAHAALYLSPPCVNDFASRRRRGAPGCDAARHDFAPMAVTSGVPASLPAALGVLVADVIAAGGHVWWLPPSSNSTLEAWADATCGNASYSAATMWGRYINSTTVFGAATTYYELEATMARPDMSRLIAVVKTMLIDYLEVTTFLVSDAARRAFVGRVRSMPVLFGGGGAGDRCVVGTPFVECLTTTWTNARTALLAQSPVDTYKWDLSPLDVNAIYSPIVDAVFIPYGIAQLPFFSSEWPEWMQMASLGAVIAHELGHAIRPEWSFPVPTMTPDDRAAITAYEDCILRGFEDSGEPTSRLVRTLSENWADAISMHTLLRYVRRGGADVTRAGLVMWMQTWCAAGAPRYNPMSTDPHSTAFLRANGTISSVLPFYQVFGCAPAPVHIC